MKPIWALGVAAGLLAGCATQPGQSAVGNVPLAPAPGLAGAATPGTVVWLAPNIAQYPARGYYIPQATVFHGAGSSFADLTDAQQQEVASILTEDARRAMSRRFQVVNGPGPGIHTLQLILVSVDPPHPIAITNGPYGWAQSVVGMPNATTMSAGVMQIAGKSIDSTSGTLLAGFAAPVSPADMMMGPPATVPYARAGTARRGGRTRSQIREAMPSSPTLEFASAASQQFATDLTSAIARQTELSREAASSQ
jgi:hypothetical protein